jgi:amino acid transporter
MAPAVNLPWDWANTLGYLGAAICLLLFVYAGRPRTFPPFSGRFFANLHRDLGYLALALVAGHVALLLVAEPVLLEHLKPSAPLYMLAGLVASVLLLVLVVSSLTGLRKRIWSDYRRFKMPHALLAIACVAFIGWHVAGSRFYLNTAPKLAAGGAAVIGLVGFYLWARLGRQPGIPRGSRIREMTGYSHLVSYGSVLLLAAIALVVVLLRLPE